MVSLCCSGGGFHLLPGKTFEVLAYGFSSGWKTSWISRGIIFVSLFLSFGFIHILLMQLSIRYTGLVVIADVFAFLTVIYGGFAMNYVNGIPLWNTALLPILYVVSGLWGGAEVTLGISLGTGGIVVGKAVEEWIRILLIGYLLLVPVYLMSVRYTSSTGQVSVRYMMQSQWSGVFWIGVVILGMIVPMVAVVNSMITNLETISVAFLYSAILSGLIGDLAMRYLILKCGVYGPLIPSSDNA
jgi:formate-dependent nitrite reductase membrane component NrfD